MSATTIARAWAIDRSDGLTLGFTDHDKAMSFEGIAFRPDSGLTARAIVQASGLSVDNSEAEGALTDDAITEADLMAGLWDDAQLRMWEVDWTAPDTRRLVFRGSLGEVSRANGAFRAELRGLSEPLNSARGRLYHPRCSARLGDGQCRADLTQPGLRAEAIVESCDEGRLFLLEPVGAYDTRWFERGVLQVLDGPAAGLQGVIKNDRALQDGRREVELWTAIGTLAEPGNRLQISAGCDKTGATCRLKFNNFLNFRGFPNLPAEDWLMAPQQEPRR